MKVRVDTSDHSDDKYSSITEEVFSYVPKWRDNEISYKSKEIRKRHNNARKLYESRMRIAQDLSSLEGDNIQADVNQALSMNGLSPEVFARWSSLISKVSTREGGYQYVKEKMRKESHAVGDARSQVIYTIFVNAFLFFFISTAKIALIDDGTIMWNIITGLSFAVSGLFYVVFTHPRISEYFTMRDNLIGSDKKKIGDFTTYEDVRTYDL